MQSAFSPLLYSRMGGLRRGAISGMCISHRVNLRRQWKTSHVQFPLLLRSGPHYVTLCIRCPQVLVLTVIPTAMSIHDTISATGDLHSFVDPSHDPLRLSPLSLCPSFSLLFPFLSFSLCEADSRFLPVRLRKAAAFRRLQCRF
jgi:hypothetical protein